VRASLCLENAVHDTRLAFRALRRNRGFSATAVLTLSLGVGLNTTIFSVVKSVLLNQLPYRDPERVVALTRVDSATPAADGVGAWTANEWRARTRSFESISLYGDAQRTLVENGEAEVLRGMRVNYQFFDSLGVTMALGRSFLASEDQWPRGNVVILSNALWTRRFGGDPRIIGRALQLGVEAYRVIGVLPRDFHPLRMSNPAEKPQIFMPLGYDSAQATTCRGCRGWRAIARLRPGVGVEAARAELNRTMREIAREYPADYAPDTSALVQPLRDRLIGPIDVALLVLSGAAAFVLLIACANVANLLLARATERSREIAVRGALGASRWRLAGHLIIESLLLSVIGGAAGVLLAWPGVSALASLAPRELPRLDEIRMDGSMFLFGLGMSVFTGLLVATAPAWRASRIGLSDELKRRTVIGGRSGLRNMLVIAEVALAFVLVAGTGLLGKSLLRLTSVDAGFDPRHILTLTLTLTGNRYHTPDAARRYYAEVERRVRAIPGVLSTGMVDNVPLSHTSPTKFRIEGRPSLSDADTPSASLFRASPDYFRVFRIPLKRGRFFTDQDGVAGPPALLVCESFAKAQFPAADPLGRHIQLGPRDERGPWLEIAGIVGDVRYDALDREPDQAIYLPQAASPDSYTRLAIRTAGEPSRYERAVREAIREIDSNQPVFHVQPMDDYIASSLADRTFTLTLIGLFGALSLLLAAVGIYGVVSYTTGLRTREVGIRMALGAGRPAIVRMVLRDVLIPLAWGLAAGFFAALALTRFLSHMLFEVRPTDVTTSAGTGLMLACAALLAGCVPALRAAGIDPGLTLRSQ
jgi:putative ABC transport system permease protein